jgi:hypothetical protein
VLRRIPLEGHDIIIALSFHTVICLPTDVDTDLQLTSGRLLRECGYGQREFWVENFVEDAVERLNGKMKVEAYHLSYDTPIEMFETFKIIAVV